MKFCVPMTTDFIGKRRLSRNMSQSFRYTVACSVPKLSHGAIVVGVIRCRGLVTPPLVFVRFSGSKLSPAAWCFWRSCRYSSNVVSRACASTEAPVARRFHCTSRYFASVTTVETRYVPRRMAWYEWGNAIIRATAALQSLSPTRI